MESKKHYKLYKSGKQWKTLAITAAVAIAGVVSFDNATANADVASSAIATTEVSQTTNDSSAVQSDATSATVVVASINSTEVSSTASAASSETVVAPVSAESVSVSAVASSATSSASSVAQSTAAVATEASSAISATSAVSSSVATTTSEATVSATSSMNDSNLSDATSTQDSEASSAAEIRAVAAAVSSTKNGWVNENGTYTYYTNGKVASGESYSYLPTINGTGHNWYLVNDGVVQSGVQQWYGSYYYFNPTNYLKLDHQDYVQSQWGSWYMVGSDGIVKSGVQKWYGKYYYFDPTTYLKLDHQDYVRSQWGDWYMVGSDGIVQSGVQKWYGKYYYFDPTTYLKLDHQDYVRSQWGDWYMVGSDGVVQSGLVSWKGSTYYFDSSTYLKVTNKTFTVGNTTYKADGNGVVTVVNDFNAKVNKALGEIGVPYVWGGNSPSVGFDCSGLVQWAYGLSSSYRTTYQQQTLGTHVYSNVSSSPKGALLFFGSDSAPYHVAISLGDGSYVHAPTVGENVKIGYQKYFTPSYYIVLS
ncbi:KxYKxGKxW signal peptide domain-containing protein [Limosilactobacillus fermentum]|uniref:NlpC/P60 family protein n=2 Tax=Limosilactobacillus fermentum TaxID=1613 RepID=UPI001432B182|nr:NlpC/P60 family protein [Limosilactobacillus fermentum]